MASFANHQRDLDQMALDYAAELNGKSKMRIRIEKRDCRLSFQFKTCWLNDWSGKNPFSGKSFRPFRIFVRSKIRLSPQFSREGYIAPRPIAQPVRKVKYPALIIHASSHPWHKIHLSFSSFPVACVHTAATLSRPSTALSLSLLSLRELNSFASSFCLAITPRPNLISTSHRVLAQIIHLLVTLGAYPTAPSFPPHY